MDRGLLGRQRKSEYPVLLCHNLSCHKVTEEGINRGGEGALGTREDGAVYPCHCSKMMAFAYVDSKQVPA